MAESHESLSEQSRRRTSWVLSVLGLIVLILFIAVLCSMRKKEVVEVNHEERPAFVVDDTFGDEGPSDDSLPSFGVQNAQLRVTPSEVDLSQVVLGSQAEAVLVLRAENGPIMFLQKYLAEAPEGGFMLGGECMEKTQLDEGGECLLKISWTPTIVQTIQNTLTIVWREDNPRVLRDERTQVQLKAGSTDSKECVCCEIEKEKEPKVLRKVVTPDGRELELNEDGTVTIDGKTYEVTGEVVIDPETGELLAVVEPERVALGLNNEYLGRVTDTRTVVDKEGLTLGRLLGDDTLVDSDFNVLGAAIPLVSVLDAQGVVIGKLVADDAGVRVVDAEGTTIGTPRVDKSVVDRAGAQIGTLRDWGMALDLSGNILGAILPTGAVIDKDKKIQGYIQQNGFVTNDSGSLVGGVVPKGVAVGTGCRSFGTVALNGHVKDAFGQVIGRAMLDGGVVDTNFSEIGSVVNQGIIVNMKGEVTGFVNSEGKGVDGKGSLMGCVAPNGTVVAGKNVVGGILQKGHVVGNACGVLGSVYPDAKVMSADVHEVGKIRADGYAINASNKVMGVVVPHGTVLAEGCRLMGVISLTGQVLNEKNMSVGCINMQKQAIDADGREIGKITPTGPVLAADGTLAGRTRYDGRIVDKNGKIIDCVNPDGTSSVGVGVGDTSKGVILDDNGLPTGWTALAGRCFNERNEEVGTVSFNGWVYDKTGRLVGFMPQNGVVFSPIGAVLGTYNQLMGTALDAKGDNLGRVMPDGTVLSPDGSRIVGSLISQGAVFVGMNGNVLGSLSPEGQLLDVAGKVVGNVLGDGSVYSSDGVLIGGLVKAGIVLNAAGVQVGWAGTNGDVLSRGTRIANLLPNGLAVTPDNRVLGRLWNDMSVVVGSNGVVGPVIPKAMNGDASAYQAAVYDKNSTFMGVLSGYGTLLGTDGRLGGVAVPVTMVMNLDHRFMGWVGFQGQVVDAAGKVVGLLSQNGVVMNATGNVIGTIIQKGTVVDSNGVFVGRVGADGAIYNASGATSLYVGPQKYIMSADMAVNARVISDGLAITSNGMIMGWTDYSGEIHNSERTIGRVGLDNRVLDTAGQMVASYVPLGAPSVQEDEKMCGVVNETGLVVTSAGRSVGSVLAPDFVVQNNMITGRIRSGSLFVRDLINADLTGISDLDSLVYRANTSRQAGTLMMNDFVVDSGKKVVAGLVHQGFATSNNSKPLGAEDYTGSVWLGGKIVGTASGISTVAQGGFITGGIFEPAVIVDRNGLEIGRSDALANVVDKSGKKIATRMAFYSALTPETVWAGGPSRTGAVIDDYARKVGVIAGDGAIMNASVFKGRILSDGSAAGVPERAVYNPMPYVGHLVTQGLPMGYNKQVLGRTTIQGDLIDASDKVVFQELDDATILGKERPLEGMVLPFRPAVSQENSILGVLNGDGKVVDSAGNEIGPVVSNGAVKGDHELKIMGSLIPETLVVNNCKVVGQTSYNGDVINGQGNTVGRMQPDQWAEDPQGKRLGRSVRHGPVMSPTHPAVYLGRTMPDSTVVDTDGVILGCAENDKRVMDPNGNMLGAVIDRGPVFNKAGDMYGRVDAMGRVVGLDNEVLGYIIGDGTDRAFDFNGNEIGRMVSKTDEILFDENGKFIGTFDLEGVRRDKDGNFLFRVGKDGKIYDQWGNVLGEIGDGNEYVYLYDMQNKPVARLVGCDLNKLPGGEKMGVLMANGDIRDDNNELVLTSSADGLVYNPDGSQFGRFAGVGMDLRRCGLSSVNVGGSGRTISWGGKKFKIDPATGMIIDNSGKVVGGWDSVNNRPYIWDTQGTTDGGRTPPPEPKKAVIPPEVRQTFSDLQKKRRAMMKDKFTEPPIEAPGWIKAMAKNKKDKDWTSVDVSKDRISTWPVDMSRVILADKAIPAVLVRSIDSRYPDVPVTAIVERHIYAEEGRNILIPAGSRLIGKLEGSGFEFGRDQAAKISISWTRLIRPDGAAFKFETSQTGDAQGRGGAAAYLDMQLLKKFALPFMTTLGEGVVLKLTEWNEKNMQMSSSTTNTQSGTTTQQTPGGQMRSMFIDNFKQMWGELMAMAGDIPNILYVPSGTRLVAYPSEDLWLRSTEDDVEAAKAEAGDLSHALLGKTDSWVKKRSQKDDEQGGSSSSSSKKDEPQETGAEEAVYLPEDINDRVVKPVSEPTEQPKAYF